VAKKQCWFVRLGQPEWARHTYARPKDDPLRLLGSVRRGMQVGALAQSADGEYFQVVGDFVVPLSKWKIEAAVAKATTTEVFASPRAMTKPAPPPIIVVKRRRVPVMAEADC